MAKCYMCGNELTDENISEEHIFLNAIGGVLKSKNLICKPCNSQLGEDADSRLAKQLQPFSVLMNVKRDRGETPPIEATRSTTKEKILVYPGGKPGSIKPDVQFFEEDGKKIYHITARTQKEINKIYRGIKKKHPTATITDTGNVIENIDEKITIECDLRREPLESVCKTAVGYYIYVGRDRKHILSFIDKLKAHDVLDLCNFCYDDNIKIGKSEGGIFHSIALVGEPNEKLLFAYIELFNYYHAFVLLNSNYEGDAFQNIYSYNLIRSGESEAFFNSTVTREMADDILTKDLHDYGKALAREMQTTVREIEVKNLVNKVWSEIELEYSVQYPDGIPTDIFIKAVSEKIAKGFLPYFK